MEQLIGKAISALVKNQAALLTKKKSWISKKKDSTVVNSGYCL